MGSLNEILITISGTKTGDTYYSRSYPDDDFNNNYSESEDRSSGVIDEEDDEDVDINYDEEDDYEYKIKKPRTSQRGGSLG